MIVALVPPAQVLDIWPRVRPLMHKAAEYTYGRYDVDDVLMFITDYDNNLWVAFEDDPRNIVGAVVTEFKHYPKKKYLDMVFCGGDDGFSWKDEMLRVLQHWAYDSHCDGIESSGRLGWAKIFKDDGYKMLWQVYELPIAACGLVEARHAQEAA